MPYTITVVRLHPDRTFWRPIIKKSTLWSGSSKIWLQKERVNEHLNIYIANKVPLKDNLTTHELFVSIWGTESCWPSLLSLLSLLWEAWSWAKLRLWWLIGWTIISLHAHPISLRHLKLLPWMMLSHGIVQENFSTDIIVPLVKDKAGDANSLGNYRAIALTPVIAKILESVVFINVWNKADTYWL